MSKPISLVLIDDNRLLREGLAGLIRKQPDFKILAASADIEEALRKVREAKTPGGSPGFRAGVARHLRLTATVRQEVPEARVIVMGLLPDVLPPQLTGSLFGQIARYAVGARAAPVLEGVRLTERERQVIDLLGEGLSNKEIAARLRIAIHTVKSHVHNVLEKLALRTRLDVASFTRSEGRQKPPAH
jgi:DNA-binding NarL/FixJ family response regulator